MLTPSTAVHIRRRNPRVAYEPPAGDMSYRTIVVGTDGSASSFRAVDREDALAAKQNAKLIVGSAHLPTDGEGQLVKTTHARSGDRPPRRRHPRGRGRLQDAWQAPNRSFRRPATEL